MIIIAVTRLIIVIAINVVYNYNIFNNYFAIVLDNHIFLFRCSHSKLATLKTMIKTLANRNLFARNIAYSKKII